MAEKEKQSIEDTWIPLARPVEPQPNGTQSLTDDDLDAIADNFQPETEADHIPVRFGGAKGDGPVIAKISALRRSNDGLDGKLVKVDPRFDELFRANKLGARNRRTVGIVRDPDTGPTMTGYGFDPPRTPGSSEWPEATSKTLDDLVKKHRSGEEVQFAQGDGRLSIVFMEPQRRDKLRGEPNSQRLSDLATKRARDRSISFGEALSQVARERPELTQPQSMTRSARRSDGWRFQTNSEALAEKAKSRADEKEISYSEALSQCAAENPNLTLPDNVWAPAEAPVLTRSAKLNEIAKAWQRDRNCSFSEALSYCAERHPELTLPDSIPLESEGS